MSILFRNVVYPLWHWTKRDGVNTAIREVEQNQWLSTADVLALQQEKLAGLLSFTRRNVPYYRTVLNELGLGKEECISTSEFRRVPHLTKSIIRSQGQGMVSEDLRGNGLIRNATSGSTGEAICFYTDLRSVARRKAAGIRSNSWTGWHLGDRVVKLWGAPIDEKFAKGLRGRLHGLVTNDRFLSSFDLSARSMDEYVKTVRRFKPLLLVAYAGPLEEFAFHCRERGVRFPSIKGIVTSAETLWPHQREVIEGAFGVKVFDRYGSREVGQIASECEAHDGLHISADRLLLEVVNDDGEPCAAGEAGRILVTDLDNYGMPLIRYDIGDRGSLSGSPCTCGRGLPMLARLEGRTMEIVRTPNGRRIGGTFWTILLKSRPGLRQVQVVQKRLDGVVINFVRDERFDDSVLDYFIARIQEHCGTNFSVTFVEKESIDVTGSGKRRLIVSELTREQV